MAAENNSSERLNRIESILERVALKQEAGERETQAIRSLVESNSRAIEATRELTESNSRAIEATRELTESNSRAIETTQKLTESNSRAIEAMIDQRVTDRLRIQRLEELSASVAKVQEGLSRMLASLDDDRPTILRKLNSIENKIDRIIEDK